MKFGLRDIFQEVESMDNVTACDITFNVVFFLGGDWKFLAMATGIDGTHACIWCKCQAIERHDSTQVWSISDVNFGTRTIEGNIAIDDQSDLMCPTHHSFQAFL